MTATPSSNTQDLLTTEVEETAPPPAPAPAAPAAAKSVISKSKIKIKIKILFLDVDGVLNSYADEQRVQKAIALRLKYIVHKIGIESIRIVLSSSWRTVEEDKYFLFRRLRKYTQLPIFNSNTSNNHNNNDSNHQISANIIDNDSNVVVFNNNSTTFQQLHSHDLLSMTIEEETEVADVDLSDAKNNKRNVNGMTDNHNLYIGDTPIMDDHENPGSPANVRTTEILQYLQHFQEAGTHDNKQYVLENWCAVDDIQLGRDVNRQIVPYFDQHFVKTNAMLGMSATDAERIIAVLSANDLPNPPQIC